MEPIMSKYPNRKRVRIYKVVDANGVLLTETHRKDTKPIEGVGEFSKNWKSLVFEGVTYRKIHRGGLGSSTHSGSDGCFYIVEQVGQLL
jgi:hypothetical protein